MCICFMTSQTRQVTLYFDRNLEQPRRPCFDLRSMVALHTRNYHIFNKHYDVMVGSRHLRACLMLISKNRESAKVTVWSSTALSSSPESITVIQIKTQSWAFKKHIAKRKRKFRNQNSKSFKRNRKFRNQNSK